MISRIWRWIRERLFPSGDDDFHAWHDNLSFEPRQERKITQGVVVGDKLSEKGGGFPWYAIRYGRGLSENMFGKYRALARGEGIYAPRLSKGQKVRVDAMLEKSRQASRDAITRSTQDIYAIRGRDIRSPKLEGERFSLPPFRAGAMSQEEMFPNVDRLRKQAMDARMSRRKPTADDINSMRNLITEPITEPIEDES